MQLTGREVFVLADTYGFPSELTFEVASEYGLEITGETIEGFEREMDAQRERGRAAARFSGARDLNRVYEALGEPPTAFVGYDALEAGARVVGLLKDNEWAPVAEEGDEVDIVLDRTPFYAEGGGQVGDTGTIVAAGGTARVDDTQRPVGDFIAHRATVTSGSIAVGGEARAAVDRERRLDVMRNHTATHLLHAVLRDALGSHVRQAGSLVAPDRLRFDFTHVAAVSPAEIAEIERTVNERIRGDLGVVKREEAQRDALSRGALAFFGERYGDTVRTVSIGEPGEANAEGPASFELCGGTHLDRTGQIGFFHVVSESSVGTGVRRVEAVTGRGSEAFIAGRLRALDEVAARLRSTADEAPQRVEALQAQVEEARRDASAGQRDASLREAERLLTQAQDVNGVKVLAATSSAPDADALRTTGDWLRDKLGSAIVVLGGVFADRPSVIAMVTPDLVDRGFNAGDIVKAAAVAHGRRRRRQAAARAGRRQGAREAGRGARSGRGLRPRPRRIAVRLLGIDVGDRRIGVAAGDTESSIAVPVGVVERAGTDADFDAVLQYATSREAEAIVAGMPLTLRGSVGPQAESVARFVEELRRRTPLFVTTVDERLTTVEAERRMRESPRPARRGRAPAILQRGAVDAAAATLILQSYLDAQPRR